MSWTVCWIRWLAEGGRRIGMLAACPYPSWQGTQVFIRHLATALQRRGHAVDVACFGGAAPGLPWPPSTFAARHPDVGLRSGPRSRRLLANLALWRLANRLLSARHWQLIHAHGLEALSLALALGRRHGLPVLYQAHSAMNEELPTYFASGWAKRLAAISGAALEAALPRRADRVLVFNPEHAQILQRRGVQPARLQILPVGLDAAELRPPSGELAAQARRRLAARLGPGPRVLYAGNPDGYQNLGLLWAAFAVLRQRLPAAQLLIGSPHPAAAFANSLAGAPSRVGIRFVPCRDLDTLRSLLHLADLGVCTRTLRSGAPIKVLNYLAAGLPVVACSAGAHYFIGAHQIDLVEAQPTAMAAAMFDAIGAGKPRQAAGHYDLGKLDIQNQIPQYERAFAECSQSCRAAAV